MDTGPLSPLQQDLWKLKGRSCQGSAIVSHHPTEQGFRHLLCSTLAGGNGSLFHISQHPEIHIRSTSPKARPCKGQSGVISERKKQNAKF